MFLFVIIYSERGDQAPDAQQRSATRNEGDGQLRHLRKDVESKGSGAAAEDHHICKGTLFVVGKEVSESGLVDALEYRAPAAPQYIEKHEAPSKRCETGFGHAEHGE